MREASLKASRLSPSGSWLIASAQCAAPQVYSSGVADGRT